MNKTTIKIISFTSFLFIVLFAIKSEKIFGGSKYDAWSFVEADVSSGIVGNSGQQRIKAVYASSSTSYTPTEWFVVLDTAGLGANVDYTAFVAGDTASQFLSPPIYFPVVSSQTLTTNGYEMNYNNLWKVMDYGEDGVFVASAPYVYKSASTSGNARRVFLLLKQ